MTSQSPAEIIYTFLTGSGVLGPATTSAVFYDAAGFRFVPVGSDLFGVAAEADPLIASESFISFMPSSPDELVTVYDMGAEENGRLMNGIKIEHAAIQIQVRNKNYSAGWADAELIALTLDNQIKTSVAIDGGDTYILHNASRRGTIYPMAGDSANGRRRHYFAIDLVATISTVT